ncbi:MAG: GntR family transcriptional regulator [Gemmatimonadota bacterium]
MIEHLRDYVIGGVHLGQLRAGDRLPSMREVAGQMRRNFRTVTAAYRALELEGLVEVRGRSGVFVARQEIPGAETSEERARWLSGVLTGAWKRNIPIPDLSQLLHTYTRNRLGCALIDDIEDGIVAFGKELELDWGLRVRIVAPGAIQDSADIDFFAVTSFYAPSVHDAVKALGKPLVVLTIHPVLQDAIRLQLREGRLTIVAADPRFGERIRVAYGVSASDHETIRVVLAGDREAIDRLDPDEPVLLTRAAQLKLRTIRVPTIVRHSPTLSPESARALADILVRTTR